MSEEQVEDDASGSGSGNGDGKENMSPMGTGGTPTSARTLPRRESSTVLRETSELIHEWRRQRAKELQKKADMEKKKKADILQQASIQREAMVSERSKAIAAAYKTNREKEKVYLAELEWSMQTKPGGNYWATVAKIADDAKVGAEEKEKPARAGSVDRGKDKGRRGSGAASSPSTSTSAGSPAALPKPGKQTDLTRMRQILNKLKHKPLNYAAAPATL
uniref:Clathrin light chain n=1 Tax=Chara australis TaxID=31298 RepID=A0A1S5WIW1_9VIRI|nr:clathrin light chain 2b [Chara australis]